MNEMEHTKMDIGKVVWRFLGAFVLYVFLTAAALWWLGVPVKSHEAPSGWTYDTDCCGKNDCDVVTKVEQRDGRWYYTSRFGTAAVGPNTKFRTSQDALTHVCIVSWDPHVYCIYNGGAN